MLNGVSFSTRKKANRGKACLKKEKRADKRIRPIDGKCESGLSGI
jgi:hypothetical protein